MSEPRFHVSLSAWVIQDGNYADFERGSESRFALEFYLEKGLRTASHGPEISGLVHKHDALYTARGIVQFTASDVWVVDFGGVLAFREEQPPTGMVPGVAVTGELYLGIDPFFYFERLCGTPGIPPLIYEWQIDGIEMETAPFIESSEHAGRKVLIRDRSKLRRQSVAKTDAWNDDSGNGDYVLICRRRSSLAFQCLDESAER